MNQILRIYCISNEAEMKTQVEKAAAAAGDVEVSFFANVEAALQSPLPGAVLVHAAAKDGWGNLLGRWPEVPLALLGGNADDVAEVLKAGAIDALTLDNALPYRLGALLAQLKTRYELQQRVDHLLQETEQRFSVEKTLIGESEKMRPILALVEKAATVDLPVTLLGETGVGKEEVARTIHYHSARRKQPFIAVNLAAIAHSDMEIELLGTEASRSGIRNGRFEEVGKGTIFLDGIAEIDPLIQAKILSVLQERKFRRFSGKGDIPFEARIIVATHRDLQHEVARGRFRDDFYYRLMGLAIELPPLRERGRDILLLAKHYANEYAKAHNVKAKSFDASAQQKLMGYAYPGNLQELRAVVEVASVMSAGPNITAEDINFNSFRRETELLNEELTMGEMKRRLIRGYMSRYDNDVQLVAQKLDIGKSTLYRLISNDPTLKVF